MRKKSPSGVGGIELGELERIRLEGGYSLLGGSQCKKVTIETSVYYEPLFICKSKGRPLLIGMPHTSEGMSELSGNGSIAQ